MRILLLVAALAACTSAPIQPQTPQPLTVTAILNCGQPIAFEIVFSDGSAETIAANQLSHNPGLVERLNLAISVSKHYAVDIHGQGCDNT